MHMCNFGWWDLAEWLEHLTANAEVATVQVRCQHPPTEWTLGTADDALLKTVKYICYISIWFSLNIRNLRKIIQTWSNHKMGTFINSSYNISYNSYLLIGNFHKHKYCKNNASRTLTYNHFKWPMSPHLPTDSSLIWRQFWISFSLLAGNNRCHTFFVVPAIFLVTVSEHSYGRLRGPGTKKIINFDCRANCTAI